MSSWKYKRSYTPAERKGYGSKMLADFQKYYDEQVKRKCNKFKLGNFHESFYMKFKNKKISKRRYTEVAKKRTQVRKSNLTITYTTEGTPQDLFFKKRSKSVQKLNTTLQKLKKPHKIPNLKPLNYPSINPKTQLLRQPLFSKITAQPASSTVSAPLQYCQAARTGRGFCDGTGNNTSARQEISKRNDSMKQARKTQMGFYKPNMPEKVYDNESLQKFERFMESQKSKREKINSMNNIPSKPPVPILLETIIDQIHDRIKPLILFNCSARNRGLSQDGDGKMTPSFNDQ
ncbi:unnamed protein product [Moneuplotes crassus]|uniref:Uncharacterized protein n=1 Tax=Euplotes crassus TaxID=5936 RepID=A0AAD1UBV2_EUPCR|nr:unnamed protein product [Moneuplotes crassus]